MQMSAPTQQEVNRVIAGYENAADTVRYEATVIMEMEQISGTDYIMVWTERHPQE